MAIGCASSAASASAARPSPTVQPRRRTSRTNPVSARVLFIVQLRYGAFQVDLTVVYDTQFIRYF